MQPSNMDNHEPHRLIASDKVEGTPVNDRKGYKIGNIERLMIDKKSGRVAYAVMSFGGFLGVGERHRPLPWRLLEYDVNQSAYVLDVDRDTLEGAPMVEMRDHGWDESRYGQQLHDYYRVPPYWM